MIEFEDLPIHLKNIFQLVRNKLSDIEDEKLYQDEPYKKFHNLVFSDSERLVTDYLFRNFKNPMKILSEQNGEVINRDGELQIGFIVNAIDGIENYYYGVRLVGFSMAVYDVKTPFGLDSILCSILGNIYSGEYFIAIKDQKAICNDKKVERFITPEREQHIYSFAAEGIDRRLLGKIPALNRTMGAIRYFGSPVVEHIMAAKGRLAAVVDSRQKLTFHRILPAAFLYKQLSAYFSDIEGDNFQQIDEDNSKKYTFIASAYKKFYDKMFKVMNK
jgi:fructose-1,6-bisphosphatase/inositol monophosphatase family enzyme